MARNDFDVIIVGAGGAGLSAALMAAEAGASVLLVDADTKVGGSTVLSGGVLYAAGTSVQRLAGIDDTPEALFNYYMALNQYRLEPGLIRFFCDQAALALEWLITLGVDFPVERIYAGGLDGVLRAHRAAGRGEEIVTVLDAHVTDHPNITVAVGTRVEELIIEGGRVCGIVANGERVTSGAVALCSGGFGANREFLARYVPEIARYGDWVWYVGSEYCRGDGLRLGISANAEVIREDDITTLLTPGFGRDFEPYIPGWFIFVDHAGRRFVNETIDYSVSGGIVCELPAGECFALFDEAARAGRSIGRKKGGETYTPPSWAPDRLAEMSAQGRIASGATLEDLANTMGINADRLSATIEEFNRDCDEGVDSRFFKDPSLLRPLRDPPYYAVRIRPAVVGITGGGLKIDRSARVLDNSSRSIPGLFAAGEVTGGIIGRCYIGGGGSLSNAFIFGRQAGVSAAQEALARATEENTEFPQ